MNTISKNTITPSTPRLNHRCDCWHGAHDCALACIKWQIMAKKDKQFSPEVTHSLQTVSAMRQDPRKNRKRHSLEPDIGLTEVSPDTHSCCTLMDGQVKTTCKIICSCYVVRTLSDNRERSDLYNLIHSLAITQNLFNLVLIGFLILNVIWSYSFTTIFFLA